MRLMKVGALALFASGMFASTSAALTRTAGSASTRALLSVATGNGPIAFFTNRDGNEEIYTMNPDGTGPTNVSNAPGNDRYPDWSFAATKIAFQSERDGNWEIYSMNADGTGQARLTTNAAFDQVPAWSPDGSKLAFQSDRDGNEELYVMNADGSGQTRLTTNAANDNHPAWSPDGSKIAFYSNRDGDNEVYVMNADGSGQTRLTTNPANDANPAWSPDGSKLAFASNRSGNSEVLVMNADGSAQTAVTTAGGFQPDWSPDGTKVAYASSRDGNEELYAIGSNGTGDTRLTTDPALDEAPDWAAAVVTPPLPGVVINTNDSGPGSLRAAIDFSNTAPGPNTISFAIPPTDGGCSGGVCRIRPLTQLPTLADGGTTIDGSTQTASFGDTNPAGPEIELRGDLAPGATGISAFASDGQIEDLAINSFSGGAIAVHGSRNVVSNNYVGTDAVGAITGNVGTGISVCCSATPVDNQILDNLVRGNRPGMIITADRTIVHGNRVELSGPQPAPPGCGQGGGIFVNGVDNVIGGPSPAHRNIVSLNGNGGILLEGGSGTIVQGNYVGTDPTGTVAAGNRCVGIVLEGSSTTNARIVDNLVSGNAQFGVAVGAGDGTLVAGNQVGTNAGGTAALGNGGGGIVIFRSNTTVGGPNPSDRNVISGNGGGGVQVCGFPSCTVSGITVQGNRIGTTADGTAAIPNFSGVVFYNTTSSLIAKNVISGGGDGINLKPGTSGVNVRGNLIGTTADGNSALGNLYGLQIGGTNNTIGGTLADDRNVIAGSTAAGVALNDTASGNTVQGNYIGTNATGATALPNATGVGIRGSSNRIGGAAAGAANVIAFNNGNGVVVFSGTGNAISRNSIFSNVALGIDLGGDGVTANDPGDVDLGANELMNYPVFDKAKAKKKVTAISGHIDTPNPQTVVIEVFTADGDASGHGEGKAFLGAVTPAADGTFSFDLPPVPNGTLITATATDAAGNTSEFAENVPAK